MYFVPEGQHDRSQARSAWESVHRENRPVGYGLIGHSYSRSHGVISHRIGSKRGESNRLAMATSLSEKIALVTGASKEIGAGISRHLAEAGAAVVVNYASDKAGA
jgi:3-oxoacyl-ACP reductase-like protein